MFIIVSYAVSALEKITVPDVLYTDAPSLVIVEVSASHKIRLLKI